MRVKGYIFIICVLAVLVGTIAFLREKNKTLRAEIATAQSNLKAYDSENSTLLNSNRVFQFTINQLTNLSDSLTLQMREVQKELGIKDSKIKSLQYILSQSSKVDTITFRDTLFRDNFIRLDTTIGDQWYKIKLSLRYPSTIITDPSFLSELYLFTKAEREPVNPRRKFFLWRLFQRKHTVYTIDIYDKNPYIEVKKNRFVEIIK